MKGRKKKKKKKGSEEKTESVIGYAKANVSQNEGRNIFPVEGVKRVKK